MSQIKSFYRSPEDIEDMYKFWKLLYILCNQLVEYLVNFYRVLIVSDLNIHSHWDGY